MTYVNQLPEKVQAKLIAVVQQEFDNDAVYEMLDSKIDDILEHEGLARIIAEWEASKVIYIGVHAYTKEMIEDQIQHYTFMLKEFPDDFTEFKQQELDMYTKLLKEYRKIFE